MRATKDGALFSPATFEPALRKNENVKELSLIALDFDHNTDFPQLCERLKTLGCAFAVHSTHSHLRATDNNPKAEPRLRAVIPLAAPVPAKDFSQVWHLIVQQIGLPIDHSKKGAASMFYHPAIAASDAPYEYHIEPGEFFDWRNLSFNPSTNGAKNSENAAQTKRIDDFLSRLKNVRQTGANQWTASCPSHDDQTPSLSVSIGKDEKIIVHCHSDKGCTYKSIFDAAGFGNGNASKQTETADDKPLAIIKASDVTPKKVDWLWYPYIPKNYVTLFSGEEGVGKSWIFCAVASGMTNGFLPLLAERFEPQNVLIFSAEDAADDALVPRLIKTGANLERVFIVNERFTFDEKGLLRFEHYIVETNPVWVIIDPLFAYSDLRMDLNKPHHARHVAGCFERIAKKFSIAISYLIHFNKSKGGGDARAAVSSSQEFSNAARSILLIGKDPNDETRRALIHRKHNYSPKGKAIGYQITGNEADVNFYWLGESTLTEREIVAANKDEDARADQNHTVAFLREILRDGAKPAKEIKKQAFENGMTEQNLRTARNKLKILVFKEGGTFGGNPQWLWKLPEDVTEDVSNKTEDVSKTNNQHLQQNHSNNTSYVNSLAEDVSSYSNQHLQPAENEEREVFEV